MAGTRSVRLKVRLRGGYLCQRRKEVVVMRWIPFLL